MPNIAKFAKALLALEQAGLLKDDACKEPVKLFIRQATEPTEKKHWHITAHYRSKAASQFIQSIDIRSKAEYQRICSGSLSHEHMVPNEVIYRLIRNESIITVRYLENLLRKFGLRATITREEDKMLSRHTMPPEFFQSGHELYMNPYARYIVAGLFDSLEKIESDSWFQNGTLKKILPSH